jgi:hypothetical protein
MHECRADQYNYSSISMTDQSDSNKAKSLDEYLKSLTLESYREYIGRNVPMTTGILSLMSGSRGYYLGGTTALYFYTSLFAGSLGLTAFFTGTYAIKQYRDGLDDIAGYVASGAVNGLIISAGLTNGRKMPHGIAIGSLLAAGYYQLSHYTYNKSRSIWIDSRKASLKGTNFVNRDIPPELLPTRQPKLPTLESFRKPPSKKDN